MCEYPHVVVTGASSGAGLVNDAGTDGFGPRPAVSVTGELDVIRASYRCCAGPGAGSCSSSRPGSGTPRRSRAR
jgi:hypothetical protein